MRTTSGAWICHGAGRCGKPRSIPTAPRLKRSRLQIGPVLADYIGTDYSAELDTQITMAGTATA
jgi:hypothetical protein